MTWCVRISVLTAGHCCYDSYFIRVRLGAYQVDVTIADIRLFDTIDGWTMPPAYVISRESDLSLYSMDLCILSLKHTEHGITPRPIGMLPAAEQIDGLLPTQNLFVINVMLIFISTFDGLTPLLMSSYVDRYGHLASRTPAVEETTGSVIVGSTGYVFGWGRSMDGDNTALA